MVPGGGTPKGDSQEGRGPEGIDRFRSYLYLLAKINLGRHLQAKISPSDIVQQTLLEAHRGIEDFRGESVSEQAAWLRKILVNNAAKAGRDLHRQKRDVAREQSLEAILKRSSVRLHDFLAANEPSPSEKAINEERFLLVADALGELQEAQQDAILLHYIEDLSMAEIGSALGRTSAAAAGLLYRGLKHLREILSEPPAV